MTIIFGFKSYEGIVLCGDSEETIDHAKRHATKLRFEPEGMDSALLRAEGYLLSAIFAGAGSGPLTDKIIDNAWKVSSRSPTLNDACFLVERSIKDSYIDLRTIYPHLDDVHILYGLSMNGESRLFSA